ncbi:MAG: leucine-rich repeat protein, partial [Blautia sp.]|nr:leucine-rich repeat protein [Blautia sp.]
MDHLDLPGSLRKIGIEAFRGALKLSGLVFPGSLEEIDYYAFYGCEALTEITIPKSVVKVQTDAGSYGPFTKSGLQKVSLEAGTKVVPSYLLYGAELLTEVEFPEGLEEIGAKAFYGCNALESLTLPGSLQVIGKNAFENCTAMDHLDLPGNLRKIGIAAFQGASKLSGLVFPESLEEIGYYAFYGCEALTEITIPKSFVKVENEWPGNHGPFTKSGLRTAFLEAGSKTVAAKLFYGAEQLVQVILPEGITQIENNAFWGCTMLKTVKIPVTVKSMGVEDFKGADALTDIYYGGEASDWSAIEIKEGNDPLGKAVFHYKQEAIGQIEGPQATKLSLKAEAGRTVKVSWSYPGELSEVRRFYLMRSEDGKDYEQVGAMGAAKTDYTDKLLFTGKEKSFYYKLVTEDLYGRKAEGEAASVTAVSMDTQAPTAKIQPLAEEVLSLGEEVRFSGASSSDNDAIYSYDWDFGDGATGTGKTASYVYTQAGKYTVTLTVTDYTGNTGKTTLSIQAGEIEAQEGYTRLELSLVDAVTLKPLGDVQVQILEGTKESGAEERVLSVKNGILKTIVKNGEVQVTAVAKGYLARTVLIRVHGGMQAQTLGLTSGSIMAGKLTVEPMTYEEIVDAGIDVNAEGNEHVYKFKTTLTFMAGAKTYEFPVTVMKNEKGQVLHEGEYGHFEHITPGEGEGGSGFNIGIFPITEKFWLIIYGEAHWLKEMYTVQLVVTNQSGTDTLEDVKAVLEIPKGMSLADMVSGEQSLSQELGTIGAFSDAAATWYVRGDEVGEYNLTAKVDAKMMPYEEEIHQEYTTSSPVKVYAGDALHMTISCEDVAERGEEYTVTYRLENVSDKSLYNLSFGLEKSEQFKVLSWRDEEEEFVLTPEVDYKDAFTRRGDELAPGGYIELSLATTIWF